MDYLTSVIPTLSRRLAVLSLFACALCTQSAGATSTQSAEAAAVTEAQQWVQLVDAGDYSQSWEAAARTFRSVVTVEQWIEAIGSVRKKFGINTGRELSAATFTKTLPGAPEGEYVVIQYSADFAERSDVVETLTVVREDGKWKTVGYFMK